MLGNAGDGTLFLFYFAGFQGFTDSRCFYVGITKEVGVVECKPDAAFLTWGDTTCERGKPIFKRKSHIHFLHSFLFTFLGMQVLSSH